MSLPNILLITTDQQHFDLLGTTNAKLKTPALDRLCREGTRFDRAYCCNPVCSPSRASLITGQYPAWHGCWTIGVKFPEDVPTIGEEFQKAGYDTSLIGKAHFQPLASEPGSESIECQPLLRDLDFWRGFHGPWYGFNHVETGRMHADESHVGQHYAIWMEEKGLANWADYFQPWPPDPNAPQTDRYYDREHRSWNLPEEFHHNCWIAERSIARMEKAKQEEKPFYLWASFFDPHPPYTVPEPWASMYDPAEMEPGKYRGEFASMPPHFAKTQEESPDFSTYDEPGGHALHGCHSHLQSDEDLRKDLATYYGMMSFLDQQIGRILDALDELGLTENTLLVFTSDHGHFIGQHGLNAKGPFHYEDLIRVPMIARYPDHIPAGAISDSMQSLVDYAPTFLAAAGQPVPGRMQGVDQSAVWTGQAESARDHVIVENRHNPTRMHLRTYVNERYKLTVYRNADEGEFFDLKNDPEELHNLWNNPEHAAEKTEILQRFLQAELQREPTRMPRIAGA